MNPPQLSDLFSGYYCVFVGNPVICTPYALFASEGQAKLWESTMPKKHGVMTMAEWSKQYKGPAEEK